MTKCEIDSGGCCGKNPLKNISLTYWPKVPRVTLYKNTLVAIDQQQQQQQNGQLTVFLKNLV